MDVDTPNASRRRTGCAGLCAITYNIRSFQGCADTGQATPGVEDIIARIAEALAPREPDILCIQEAQREQWVAALAQRLGMSYAYFPGGWRGDGWPEGISGAVLTRLEIIEARDCPSNRAAGRRDDLFTRFWGQVTLAADGGELVVHAAHLHHTSAETRLGEIDEILAAASDESAGGESLIVMGDLNHEPDTAEYHRWSEAGMADALALKGTGDELTWPSLDPEMRIDYLWLRGPITSRLTTCRVLCDGDFRAPADGFALSDHLPLLARFAGVSARG